MSGGAGEVSLADLKASVDRGPVAALALAMVAAGVTTVLVALAYGFAFDPPVTAGNVFPPETAFDSSTEYRQFYRLVVVFDALDSAPLFLPGFGVVTAVGVAPSRGRESTVRLGRVAVAVGLAVGTAYAFLGTVGVWTLPPGSSTGPVPPVVRSDVLAVATNALALAAVTAVGTIAGTLALTPRVPWASRTEDGA